MKLGVPAVLLFGIPETKDAKASGSLRAPTASCSKPCAC